MRDSFVTWLTTTYICGFLPVVYLTYRIRSHVTTDGQSVIMSRYRAHSGTCDQILLSARRLFSENCCLVSVGRPLWREVEVTLQLTVGQSVSMSRYRAHSGVCDQILLSARRFFLKIAVLSLWGALSDEKSKSRYNWRSVSQSVCQGIEPTLGLVTRYCVLSEGCFLKVAVLSVWDALSDEKSKSRYNWRPVSMSRYRANSGTCDQGISRVDHSTSSIPKSWH
jgi:hypothetical protein